MKKKKAQISKVVASGSTVLIEIHLTTGLTLVFTASCMDAETAQAIATVVREDM